MASFLVRCCCDPGTIYGYIEIAGDRRHRDGERPG